MKRQNIRKGLMLISFLLFPITIFYFSPVLIIEGAAQGIATGSFVVFCLLFLASLFFGRAFCGWVCPGGGLQECCTLAANKKAKGGKYNWIKYIIWLPWVTTIVVMAGLAEGLKKVDFFYQIKNGISVSEPFGYIIYYFFVGLIVILAFTVGKRSFCHYVCWMAPFMVIGQKLNKFFGLPLLYLSSKQELCTKCKRCNKNCQMSLDVMAMVQAKSMDNAECILCGECVDGCPKGAIKYSFGAFPKNDRTALGTNLTK